MQSLSESIIEKTLSFGASLSGIASEASIRKSPSHKNFRNFRWPAQAKSIIVLALKHDSREPSLDWWDGNLGTPGNRKLASVTRKLKRWLKKKYGIAANDVPYHIHKGGVFLKDSAVCAGLGVIGKNNLLISPDIGPRIRLRALFVNSQIEPTRGPESFAPCINCEAPCLKACPQNAFGSGSYDRSLCQKQLEQDEIESTVSKDAGTMYYPDALIKYCRSCELACPVGDDAKDVA
jgi:epoxyqueuosine reductase